MLFVCNQRNFVIALTIFLKKLQFGNKLSLNLCLQRDNFVLSKIFPWHRENYLVLHMWDFFYVVLLYRSHIKINYFLLQHHIYGRLYLILRRL